MGFSSTTWAGCTPCASIDAFVLLLRTGAAFGSFGSAGLRGFLVFFSGSGTLGSFGFGFGPGFLRGCPDAVRPRGAGDVADAGVGVLVFAGPTPTPVLETRAVDVGVPSGECGGELRLPGEDASFSMIVEHRKSAGISNSAGCPEVIYNSMLIFCIERQVRRTQIRGAGSASSCVADRWLSGGNSTPRVVDGVYRNSRREHQKSMCGRVPGRREAEKEPVARRGTRSFNP